MTELTSYSSPEALFDGITQFVAESRLLLKQGAMMELVGLDGQMALLCDGVLELSQEQRVRYAERLQALLSDLRALGEELIIQRDAMAQAVHYLPNHKKASVAYRVADTIDSGRKEPTE